MLIGSIRFYSKRSHKVYEVFVCMHSSYLSTLSPNSYTWHHVQYNYVEEVQKIFGDLQYGACRVQFFSRLESKRIRG